MLIFEVLLVLVVPVLLFKIVHLITHRNCKSKVCLIGKTALVTGGNAGIGYQIVLALLQRGCRVIIADKTKDPNLFEKIYKETRSKNVVFEYVDLSSFESTRGFARNIKKSEEKLDILIHNAGVGRDVLATTDDGLDVVMQINYFSAFLLTHLLVDLLKIAKGRIIFTSSLLSFVHNLTLEKLRPVIGSHEEWSQYPNSKLAVIIAGDIFADKLRMYGITSNTYHPGLVYTNIFMYGYLYGGYVYGFAVKLGNFLAYLVGKTAEEGAQTAIHLACANEVENITGEFFFETKTRMKPTSARNKKFCQDVWKATEKLVDLKPNEKL